MPRARILYTDRGETRASTWIPSAEKAFDVLQLARAFLVYGYPLRAEVNKYNVPLAEKSELHEHTRVPMAERAAIERYAIIVPNFGMLVYNIRDAGPRAIQRLAASFFDGEITARHYKYLNGRYIGARHTEDDEDIWVKSRLDACLQGAAVFGDSKWTQITIHKAFYSEHSTTDQRVFGLRMLIQPIDYREPPARSANPRKRRR